MKNVSIIRPETADLVVRGGGDQYLDIHGILEIALTLADPSRGEPDNVLINSPHGLGKTLLAKTFTQELSRRLGYDVPLLTIQCSAGTRESHLMGSMVGVGDETPFVLGPFPLSIELANEVGFCVVCAEEISKLPPEVQGEFNKRTDWQQDLVVPALGRVFRLREDAHIVMIANMNPSSYAGVYDLNDDLRSRFNELVIPYPDKDKELRILRHLFPKMDKELLKSVCRLGFEGRTPAMEYQISTRDMVKLLKNIKKFEGELAVPLLIVANKFIGTDRDVIREKIAQIFAVEVPE